jgi:hypothetical protein
MSETQLSPLMQRLAGVTHFRIIKRGSINFVGYGIDPLAPPVGSIVDRETIGEGSLESAFRFGMIEPAEAPKP